MVGKKNVICPVSGCRRHFANAAALAQHKADSHQKVQVTARSRPRQRQNKTAQSNGLRKNRAFGSDMVGTYLVPANAVPGRLLIHKPIAPLSFPGTRLYEESQLWTRWRPIKLTAHLEMAGAATTYGGVMLGWTADSSPDMQGSAIDILRRVSTFKPLKNIKLNQNGTISVPVETARKWLQTTGDIDQTAQGDLVVIVSAQTGGYTGGLTMMLRLDWELEYEGPTLGFTSTAPATELRPDAGWTNLFTTSDGSFDSGRLTFKMHHGGSMCPFSGAAPGVVYTLADQTRVPYVQENGTEAIAKYFAKVQGYEIPGLLLFASYADARSYITSGDLTKALPFKAAGSEVTPATPVFKAATSLTNVPDNTALENKVDRLTEMYEQMMLLLTQNSTVTTAPRTDGAIRRIENMLHQVSNPLQVSLDRGTFGTPLVTFSEDPVRAQQRTARAQSGTRDRTHSGASDDYERV